MAFSALRLEYLEDFVLDRLNRNEPMDEFFYSLRDLLIVCKYNRMDCSAADFVSFQTSHHGLCHTFNAKTNRIRNGSLLSTTDNGEDGILTLQLYSRIHAFIPQRLEG